MSSLFRIFSDVCTFVLKIAPTYPLKLNCTKKVTEWFPKDGKRSKGR